MKSKKILVVGSNSFSGGSFVDYLLENTDYDVAGASRSTEPAQEFLPYQYRKRPQAPRFSFTQLDLNNTELWPNFLDWLQPNIVVNFAAQSNVENSWDKPWDWVKTNCLALTYLADYLRHQTFLEHYIQISTPEVYGPCIKQTEDLNRYGPTTPYAASKAGADMMISALVRSCDFPASFVRSANVYGKHQQLYKIIPKAIIMLKQGKKVPLHNGGLARRNFIHISDVSRGLHKIIENERGIPGTVYHFSSGRVIKIHELVQIICHKLDMQFEDSVEISGERSGQDSVYDLSRVKTMSQLDWDTQVELEDGIDEVIQWVEECWDELQRYPLQYIHQA